MHPMEPVELCGELVAIEPLTAEHAEGILAAADSDEVFSWLPYPRPGDLGAAQTWITDALADRDAHRRLPFAVRGREGDMVIGSTSYWDFDAVNALSRSDRPGSAAPRGEAARIWRRSCC